MEIRPARREDGLKWNAYAEDHHAGCMYHRFEWAEVFSSVYRHKAIYLLAEHKGSIVGILPFICIENVLLGRVMVSLPYFGHGGILADNQIINDELMKKAIDIGAKHNVKHIEFRHPGKHPTQSPKKTHKALMILDLKKNAHDQLMSMRPRLRNKIRNALKADFTVRLENDTKAFYQVYADNMRFLGTPCHAKKLFVQILNIFPENAFIMTVFHQGNPLASALGVTHGKTIEIPFVSSLRETTKNEANTRLHWSLIEYAHNSGMTKFSFGRSSKNSGTFEFKRRWGAIPTELPYSYYCIKADCRKYHPHPARQKSIPANFVTTIWKKMPLSLTNFLGPKILRQLPIIL